MTRKSRLDRFLDAIERGGNALPHPAPPGSGVDRRGWLAAMGALAATAASARAAAALSPAGTTGSVGAATPILADAVDAGWSEAVCLLGDGTPLNDFATQVAGWQYSAPRPLDPSLARFMALPTDVSRGARQWRISDGSGRAGALRVIESPALKTASVDAAPAKDSPPWFTGGLFSLMVRSNALRERWNAARQLGWEGVTDPVELEFSGVKLANVILRGPQGLRVSIYERILPRMADEPDLRLLRRPFNSMQVVADLALARRFYVEGLGFEVVGEGRFRWQADRPNNFGVPSELAAAAALDYLIVAPRAGGPTQVEIVHFTGLPSGRRPAVGPEQPGLYALRFPVTRVDALRSRLADAGWPMISGVMEFSGDTGEGVRAFAAISPEGARLEFEESAGGD